MSLYPDPLDERLNDSESAFWDQGRIHNWQNYPKDLGSTNR